MCKTLWAAAYVSTIRKQTMPMWDSSGHRDKIFSKSWKTKSTPWKVSVFYICFFAMKRCKRINIFWFFVHLVRDNFISFITSHVAHDTKRVIERLYTARLCFERNAWVVLAYGLHYSLFFCLKSLHEWFFAELRCWNARPQNNVKRMTVWKCKETIFL